MDSINNIYIPPVNEITAHLNNLSLSGKGSSFTKDSYFKSFAEDGNKIISIRLHRYGNGSATNKVFNKPFYKNCKNKELSVPCDYLEFLVEEEEESTIKTVRIRLTHNGEFCSSLRAVEPMQKLVQYLIDNPKENKSPYIKIQIKVHAKVASIYEVKDATI